MADLNVYPASVQYLGDVWKIINGRGQVDVVSGGGGGGGTEYVDGDAVSPITGTAILWDDAGRVRVPSAAFPLPVSGGGGVQYVEGDTTNPVTGTAMLFRNNSGELRAVWDDTDPLPVKITAFASSFPFQLTEDSPHSDGDPLILAGVVQQAADAALSGNGDRSVMQVDATGWLKTTVKESALPTGAATEVTLAMVAGAANDAATSLDIIDDWDESDRAKVNPIVGQAGVAAGTGVDGATVQRVTLATNVPLPAGTNNIGDVDILSIAAGNNNIGDVDIASIAAGNNNIGDVDIASLPNEGQQTMANSISVAIASNQSTLPVDTELPAANTLGTTDANPSTPLVGACLMNQNTAASTWRRNSGELHSTDTAGDTNDAGAHISDMVKTFTFTPTNVNTRYDDSPVSATSASQDARRFRYATMTFSLDSTLSPTDILINFQQSANNGTTWMNPGDGYHQDLRYDDTVCATIIHETIRYELNERFVRVFVTATGTNSTNFFDLSNMKITLHN